MKARNILISVIIPTYNRCQSLKMALKSLCALDFAKSDFEVVVVDNHCTDDTAKVAKSFRQKLRLAYVREPKLSFTVARHTGAGASAGRILTYIDDDVAVTPGWMKAIVTSFNSSPDIGMVGGPIWPKFETPPPGWIKKYYPMSGWLSLLDLGQEVRETMSIYGPNLSVRKDILETVGGFPPDTIGVESKGKTGTVEKIYVGSGDGGLCTKVKQAGYCLLYNPAAAVYHVIPPIRLTKEWWHSRFAGEGCYHALTSQYENPKSKVDLFFLGLLSRVKMEAARFSTLVYDYLGWGKERQEFWVSYWQSHSKVERVLTKHPDLAVELWKAALHGTSPSEIEKLASLLKEG